MTIRALASDLARRIRVAGEAAFAKDDTFARHNGWTIEVRRGGLGRTYHDPRFDRLSRCPACGDAMDANDLAWRWRYEIGGVVAMTFAVLATTSAIGLIWTITAAAGLAIGIVAIPESRRIAMAHA